MKRDHFALFGLISLLLLAGCSPKISQNSDVDQKGETPSINIVSSEAPPSDISSPSSSLPAEDTYTVDQTTWINNFTNGYYPNFRQHIFVHAVQHESFLMFVSEENYTISFDNKKVAADLNANQFAALDFSILYDELEAAGELAQYETIVANILSEIREEYGEPAFEDGIYYVELLEAEDSLMLERYNEEFVYFYEALEDNTYERYLENVASDDVFDQFGIYAMLREEFDQFTYDETTNTYVGEFSIYDNEFNFVISFVNGHLMYVQADFSASTALEDRGVVNNYLRLSHEHYNNVEVNLPSEYYECKHAGGHFSNYYQSDHSHYKYCQECHHVAVIEEHHHVDGYCDVCGHFPTKHYEIFIDGYEEPFGFYQQNTINNAIEWARPYTYEYISYDGEWQIYKTYYADVIVMYKVYYEDDPLDTCAYTYQSHMKFIEASTNKVLYELKTNSGEKYENHHYQEISRYKTPKCELYITYKCNKCGKIVEEYEGIYHDFIVISETEIDPCTHQIVEECKDCGERRERTKSGDHDFYLKETHGSNEYGMFECKKCGKSFDAYFYRFYISDKVHSFEGEIIYTGHYFHMLGLHELDDNGVCTTCGHHSDYVKTSLLSELGETVYGLYEDGRLIDFYLADASNFSEAENYYDKYGENIIHISLDIEESYYVGQDLWIVQTYVVGLNFNYYTTITTEVVHKGVANKHLKKLYEAVVKRQLGFTFKCLNC